MRFEGLNCHFGAAGDPCMNFTQLWLPTPGIGLQVSDTGALAIGLFTP
jgi:hypothetical protein